MHIWLTVLVTLFCLMKCLVVLEFVANKDHLNLQCVCVLFGY